MEINKKIQHLSEEEIQELIKDYEDKSIKISSIINKYSIDIKPRELLKILPPVRTETVCIHCGNLMLREREGRTSYSYEKIEYCEWCGHKEYIVTWGIKKQCECKGCIEYRERIIQEKHNKIKLLYGKEQPKINFSEMNFQDQLTLIYILVSNPKRNIYEIEPIELYGEDKKQWIRKLNRLMEIEAISVSPNTSISAFNEKDFPYTVFLDRANYKVNVIFDENIIEQINDNKYFKENISGDDKLKVFKEYIYRDAINNFKNLLEERRLELNISETADDLFRDLINKVSYTQLINLCYKVARFFSDKVITGDMNRKVACNVALINVSKFYENAVEAGWELYHSDYDCAGKELKFYIERVLGKKLKILKEIPSVDIIENFEDIDKSYDNDTKRF